MNYIKINDKTTYPKEFTKFCEDNKEKLLNTFSTRWKLDSSTEFFEMINNMLGDYEIECYHAARTLNEHNYYESGLLQPIEDYELANLLFSPIEHLIPKDLLSKCYETLKEILKRKEFNYLHFVICDECDVNMENGFLMLKKYGGELVEDTFANVQKNYSNNACKFYEKNISHLGKPVVIKFKVKLNDIINYANNDIVIVDLYLFMLKKVLLEDNLHYFKALFIYKPVDKKDIISVDDYMGDDLDE